MDINDIGIRLKRVYRAVDKQFESDIDSSLNVKKSQIGRRGKIEFTFGKYDAVELDYIVIGVVSAIAGLKDHLKNKLESLGENPKIVEGVIDNCFELQLIVDLWNQDKHGYPLKKRSRSNKDPQIKNLKQALTIKDTTKGSGSLVFSPFSPETATGVTTTSNNLVVKITGDIVDKNGKALVSLDEMVSKSLSKFEVLIKKYRLI